MKKKRIEYTPLPYQQVVIDAIFKEKKKAVAFVGGIKTGKTWLGARVILKYATQYPNKLCWIVAPDFTMADVCRREIEEILYSSSDLLFKTKEKPFWRVDFPNGSSIHLRSADRPHTLRGPNVDFIWVDEAAYLPNKSYDGETFDILLGRTAATGGQLLLTTTPKGKNWLYERFVLHRPDDYAIFNAAIGDNIYVPEEEKRRLYSQYSGLFLRQELNGEFVQFEGLVFPEFTPEKVYRKYPKKFSKYDFVVMGVDWGFSEPSAVIVIGVLDGIYWVIGEFYKAQQNLDAIYNVLKNFRDVYSARLIYVDPSATLLIQELQKNNLPVLPAVRQPVLLRLGLINTLLSTDRLRITSAAPNLIQEMLSYVFVSPEKPSDERNHAIDALGYALVSMPTIGEKKRKIEVNDIYIPDLLDLEYEGKVKKEAKRYWITGY